MSSHKNQHASLLPSEQLALAIYYYAESSGVGQWRAAIIADLGNYVSCHDARLVDTLKDLWSKGYLALRKWPPESHKFIPFSPNNSEEDFFYRGDFQIKVEYKGRLHFEGLELRKHNEKSQLMAAVVGTNSDFKNEEIMQSRPLKIFLCHASEDKTIVRDLYQRLRSNGFLPWLDSENLIPGQEWEPEIRKAVRASEVVLVCLSRSSVSKEGFVQKEIRLALDIADEKPEGIIFMIPVQLEPCQVPDRLSRWQWVDLFQADGYDNLLRSLHARAASLGIARSTIMESVATGLLDSSLSSNNSTPESLADKFQIAVARDEQQERAARELTEKKTRFETNAMEAAPAEFEVLANVLRTQADEINAKHLKGMPVLQYVPVNHRVDAGKYAVKLNPLAGLRSYSVTVAVGLHPNAQQFMDEVPIINTNEQTFTATTDEKGFAWRDDYGNVRGNEHIVNDVLNALANLLTQDL